MFTKFALSLIYSYIFCYGKRPRSTSMAKVTYFNVKNDLWPWEKRPTRNAFIDVFIHPYMNLHYHSYIHAWGGLQKSPIK